MVLMLTSVDSVGVTDNCYFYFFDRNVVPRLNKEKKLNTMIQA